MSSLPKEQQRAAYAEVWTRFNRHFNIAKYAQLQQDKFPEALNYLISMKVAAARLSQGAQKALSEAPKRRNSMPNASQIEALVEAVKFQGSEMHKALDNLWSAIWPGYGSLGGSSRHFVSMSQLRYVSEDIFRTLSSNIEACRRVASTAGVVYRELTEMNDMRR